MRISDWSSDVCSSDLLDVREFIIEEGAVQTDGTIEPVGLQPSFICVQDFRLGRNVSDRPHGRWEIAGLEPAIIADEAENVRIDPVVQRDTHRWLVGFGMKNAHRWEQNGRPEERGEGTGGVSTVNFGGASA